MNRQEFEDTAKRYREEMLRMYLNQPMNPPGRPVPPPPPRPENRPPAPLPPPRPENRPPAPPPPPRPENRPPVPPPPPRPENRPPAPPPPPRPENRPPAPPPPPRPENRPPAPPLLPSLIPPRRARAVMEDASEFEQPADISAEQETDNTPQKRPYTGTIRVHVSTARGARPVPGATITVTRTLDGQNILLSLQTTDDSGNIAPVTVPAPPPSEDQRHPQAYYYEISAQAAGYYREHSMDVPVFPYITSMQNFDLIPLPAGTDDPVPGGDLTYYNNMQQY